MKKNVIRKNKLVIMIVILFFGLVAMYWFDPPFKREVKFENFAVQYEWRVFNNLYCNSKTKGHCYTNEINKLNAEVELYRRLLDNYNGAEKIEAKLKDIVGSTYRFDRTYRDLTRSDKIEMDSLVKYKDKIFKQIELK